MLGYNVKQIYWSSTSIVISWLLITFRSFVMDLFKEERRKKLWYLKINMTDHWYKYPAAILRFPSMQSIADDNSKINKNRRAHHNIEMPKLRQYINIFYYFDAFFYYFYSFISKNIINVNTLPFIKQFNIMPAYLRNKNNQYSSLLYLRYTYKHDGNISIIRLHINIPLWSNYLC